MTTRAAPRCADSASPSSGRYRRLPVGVPQGAFEPFCHERRPPVVAQLYPNEKALPGHLVESALTSALLEISRTATEESGFVVQICCQPPYFFYIPKLMFVPRISFAAKTFNFLSSRWPSLVGQFSITIYRYLTAAAQLLAYRAFARAGDSLNKIISAAHRPFLSLRLRTPRIRV
jgi:hypothetical protein